MGERTAIQWTDFTFNPWWGCTRVSPGCEHCYAERDSKRHGFSLWGPQAGRRFFADAHWHEPVRWNAKAASAGQRRRVFCASFADVFEERPELNAHRLRLWPLIEGTPWLDWQILTKRPQNVLGMVPYAWTDGRWPRNAWLGTTAEDQQRAEERIAALLLIPAPVRFVSYEPALGPMDLRPYVAMLDVLCCPRCGFRTNRKGHGPCPNDGAALGQDVRVDWVIVGGESGPGARPFDLAWARSAVAQCKAAGVPVFVKQLGARPIDTARIEAEPKSPDDVLLADGSEDEGGIPERITNRLGYLMELGTVRLKDRKGGDPAEWPEDLRVREFPQARA